MSVSNSFQLGLESLKARNVDEAVRHLEEAANEVPEDYRAFNYLGVAYAQKGLHDRAVGAFLTAAHLQPKVASIRYNLGLAYQADGFRDKAREEFQTALQIDPMYAKAEDALRVLQIQDNTEQELHDQSCGRHVDEPAVAVCSFCRLPICAECKKIVHDTVYCPKCAQQAIEALI